MGDPPPVLCLDCSTPCRSPLSRARRVGSGCWRKRRRKARAQAVPVALPGLSGRGARAGQDGPDLLDSQAVDPDQDGAL
ncbi:hypothetical protein [Micromonospora sp. RTP1Z1]|uniref:hypothetical protein n=1 Tax=Micromonospora sp. RTP1Z1 TaxID=2994043 RepID=UPI0029C729EA|nr:hypothetical protein [Micromonospora sp. RTP1Z1]